MRRALNSGEHRLPACSIRPLAECPCSRQDKVVKLVSRQAAANYRPAACAPQKQCGITTATSFVMQSATRSHPQKTIDPDIFFRCEHCNTSLVVNRAAAGMSLRCQDCGKLTAVPKPSEPGRGRSRAITG